MKNLAAALLLLASASAFGQQKWAVDPSHSGVKFSVTHMMVSEVDGRFTKFNGTIDSASPDFVNAKISFTVDVNSISTDNEMRDKHLKSDDFFNAEKFPSMTFTSTSFKRVKGNKYILEGNLTIRDVTKKVRFSTTLMGKAKSKQGMLAAFKATAVIDRLAFGLKWNALTEAGGAMVGKDVTINLNLEFGEAK
jgi:polyisoprenoid-binding protein YceI